MKFLKYKIALLAVLVSLSTFVSCEDNESGVELIGLEARFIIDMVDSRTVEFVNTSNDAATYAWNFGDGTTSATENPTKRYVNGTYTVSLTATDSNGNTSVFEDTIIIDGCVDEGAENVNPANGDLNWNFQNGNGAFFEAFGNIGGQIVANPVLDDVNRSCYVQVYSKTPGCETWSGVGIELETALDFSTITNKTFKMKVLAETQITDVTLRLEFMPFPNVNPFQERIASITQVGQWQELTFDFTNVNAGTFKSMIIYFERNAACDGDVYYFDDITQE